MLLIRRFAAIGAIAWLAVWAATHAMSADEEGTDDQRDKTDVSTSIDLLGNPLTERYSDGSRFHYARSITDLHHFNGKLYLGHGDWGENSGPTDIWYFDLKENRFVKQGQIDDEAAEHYRIIEGKLYVPGMDPQEDWSLGNFYRLDNGKWVKHRTLPGAVHNFDMVGVDRKLFAATSRLVDQPPCLMVSADDGKTWTVFEIPAEAKIPPDVRLHQRLLVIDGKVYVPGIAKSGEVKVYRFNGQGFDACTGDMLPGVERPFRDPKTDSWTRVAMEKTTTFKGKCVYLGSVARSIKEGNERWRSEKSSALFVAALASPIEFRAERSLTESEPTDLAVDDERCYVVSYRWKNRSDPKQGAVTTVSSSTDLKNWTKLFSVHYETFASAIEVVDGDFFLGLGGTREYCTSSTGIILKVGKDTVQ